MKRTLALLILLLSPACSEPEVPPVFSPDSPASIAAPTSPRPPVAAVLEAPHPLDASVHGTGDTRVLPAAPSGPTLAGGSERGLHDHAGHGPKPTPAVPENDAGHHHDHAQHNHP